VCVCESVKEIENRERRREGEREEGDWRRMSGIITLPLCRYMCLCKCMCVCVWCVCMCVCG